jgi:magnesium transporter
MIILHRIRGHASERFEAENLEALLPEMKPDCLHWFDIDFGSDANVNAAAAYFGLHPLLADDIRNRGHLPKYEAYEELVFLTCKMLLAREDHYETEHLSLVLGKDWVLSFQDNLEGDNFQSIRRRLENDPQRFFRGGADFLFISLLDAVVDTYNAVLQTYRDRIEDIEAGMLDSRHTAAIHAVTEVKSELGELRRNLLPLREEVMRLRNEQINGFRKANHIFMRDILDHLQLMASSFESYREMLHNLTELHLSNLNLQLNRSVKTLTIVSAVFIPLTFIAGIYGMNFRYMPELEWQYGYAGALLLMALVALLMLRLLKRL